MKNLITVLFLIMSLGVDAEELYSVIFLQGEITVEIREFTPSRITPVNYFNQAMESIPVIYPQSEIITTISHSRLKADQDILYSLVGYIEYPQSPVVSAGGQVLVKDRAWQYYAEIPKEQYPELQNKLIEKVASLAFNKK